MDDSVRMKICVATSLAIIIPTAVRSVRSHWQRGAVDAGVIKTLGPWVVGGAIAGVFVASHAPASFLKGVFVASTLFIAGRLAFGNGATVDGAKLPGLPWDALAGAGIGLISTLIGIGGGAYITAYMKFLGWPIHKAVGTAAGFGPLIAIPATIGFMVEGWGAPGLPPLSLGYVSLLGLIVVAPVSVLAAPLGVRRCAPAFAPDPRNYFHDLSLAGCRPVCREPRVRRLTARQRFVIPGSSAARAGIVKQPASSMRYDPG